MEKFTVVAALAVLLLATPAFAQTTIPAYDLGNMNDGGYHQSTEVLTTGKITEIDLANGTLTLDTGMQFTLSPALQYTSFPALGEDAQVTYSERGGQKVARIIEVGGTHSQGTGNQ
jgi:hypothetical protein